MTLEESLGKEKVDELVKFFDYLESRWRDEHKYEDFNEYIEAFEKKLGSKVSKFSKKPFQVEFKIGNNEYYLKIKGKRVECGEIATTH